MTQKPTALAVKLEGIPDELKAIDRWVMWKLVQRTKPNGQKVWAKMPVTVDNDPASSVDAKTWTTYDEVCDALIMGTGFDGIGLVLGADIQGIDLDDCRDPATGELTELAQEVLDRVEGYAEVSPSGTGIKVFARTNLDGSRTKKEAGVELYREGRYFTVTGHQVATSRLDTVNDIEWFVEKVFGDKLHGGILEGDAAEVALALYKPPLEDWDVDRVAVEVLPHLDPDCGYEEWLKIGAALHHQGGGDGEWLDLWDTWSAMSGKYVEGYCAEKWSSFNQQRAVGHGAVTLASLLKKTKDARDGKKADDARAAIEESRAMIADCTDDIDLRGRVSTAIRKDDRLDKAQREILVSVWNQRHRELTGTKLPVADVRNTLGAGRAIAQQEVNANAPEWAQPWVFVTDGDKFFHLETKQEVTATGFRSMYNRLMPFDEHGNRERADIWATEMWNCPVVAHKAYLPAVGPVFEMFGLHWANLYRPESVPDTPEEYTPEDLAAIDVIKHHLNTYLADQRERDLLLSWCAHNVQHPGVKIRWSPYIHGVPGDGKSFWSELIAVAMGGQNVRSLNGSTLESNFTDWAAGYAVVAIEEMKQHGHNRYDIMNRVKPFITNTVVEIHPKGKPSYTAPNVSNYIIFSNYLDGAPVDAGDRRYMFLSSQLTSEKARELTEAGYFKNLFEAIQEHAGAIRKWLLELPLHPEFDANGRAPDTEVKHTVIEMSKSDLEAAAEDLIERGAEGVTAEVVSSAHLTRALSVNGAEAPSTSRVNTLLTRLGFRFAWRKKWKGEACRIWVVTGSNLNESAAMARLNESKSDFSDFLE